MEEAPLRKHPLDPAQSPIPLIFVLLPPIAGGLLFNVTLPEQTRPSQEITSGANAREVGGPTAEPKTAQAREVSDRSIALVSYVFYPTYYSLLVVVSTIFGSG